MNLRYEAATAVADASITEPKPAAGAGGTTTDLVDLLSRAASGDQVAFGGFYDATSARVYGLARRILRDPDHAAEVSQEVYLEIWRNSARYDPARGTALAWTTAITYARSVDRVRSEEARRRREEVSHQAEVALHPVAPNPTHDTVVSSLSAFSVRKAVSALPPVQREVLELAFYDGLTHVEMAQRTGVSLGTVKSRVRGGLSRLRNVWDHP